MAMIAERAARRPGAVLAACVLVGFAALAGATVQQAVMLDGGLHGRVLFAAEGFGDFPSLCLVVAAILVLMERLSMPVEELSAQIVAGIIFWLAIVAVGMNVIGVVELPIWSTSASAADWVSGLSPFLTAGALAALATVLVDRAMRGLEPSADSR